MFSIKESNLNCTEHLGFIPSKHFLKVKAEINCRTWSAVGLQRSLEVRETRRTAVQHWAQDVPFPVAQSNTGESRKG